MNVENIIKQIAEEKNIPTEEVEEANIDELFSESDMDQHIGYLAPIWPLSHIIDKNLPEGYSIEVGDPDDEHGFVDIYLQRTLKENREYKDELRLKHKETIKVELAGLCAQDGFGDEPDFRKIGDILNTTKAAYDMIEEYLARK